MLENKEGRYFHVTPKENIGQIMSNGLIPAIGPRSEEANEDVALVYMFPNVSDMETALANWLGECFEEDEDYGLAPTFSEDGKSNQWFCAYYETISSSKWKVIILTLNEDGTFKLRDCERDNAGHQSDGTVYEGKYTLDGSILNLTHDGGTIPFLYVNEKIYFDVIQKTA